MTTKHNYAKTGYIVSDAVLTHLAQEYASGVEATEGVRGTYLRILVAHSKRELETRGVKRATTDIALAAVQAAHDQLYPVILKAITTPDVAPDKNVADDEMRRRTQERNRRSNFARTSKTALVNAIKAGERLAALDPATVTKEMLMARYAQVRAGPGTPQERITRLWDSVKAQLTELAKEDVDAAREQIRDLEMSLQAVIEPPRQIAKGKMKRGELTLHPH